MKIHLSRRLINLGLHESNAGPGAASSWSVEDDLSVMRLIAGLGILGYAIGLLYAIADAGLEAFIGRPFDWSVLLAPVPALVLWRATLYKKWACICTLLAAWGIALGGLAAMFGMLEYGAAALPFAIPTVIAVLYTVPFVRAWNDLASGI